MWAIDLVSSWRLGDELRLLEGADDVAPGADASDLQKLIRSELFPGLR